MNDPRPTLRSDDGFTLVEMLTAMAVFSIVLAMFALVLSSAIRHSGEVEEQSNLQVEARGAITAFTQDLRQVYDGDADPLTTPIEYISPTGTEIRFLSPDRLAPFHIRRISYRINAGKFERAMATSTDTDGPPWVLPWVTPPPSSYRKLVGSVTNATVFAYKKADGNPATTALTVKTVDVVITVATKTTQSRQITYKASTTVRGEG